MIHQCANPACGKPLHYLRDGKIFVFDLPDVVAPVQDGGRANRRLQHFWLCGSCAETMMMVQSEESQIEIRVKLGTVDTSKPTVPSPLR